jgi:hypothetical protein
MLAIAGAYSDTRFRQNYESRRTPCLVHPEGKTMYPDRPAGPFNPDVDSMPEVCNSRESRAARPEPP